MADSCTGNPSYCTAFTGPHSFNLRLTQSGRTRRAFIFVCGAELDPVTGTLGTDGTITLSGQGQIPPYDPMMLSAFRSIISGASMTGTFSCTVTSAAAPSNTYSLTGRLQDVSLYSRDPNVPF